MHEHAHNHVHMRAHIHDHKRSLVPRLIGSHCLPCLALPCHPSPGFPIEALSSRGWSALDEAVSLGDEGFVRKLHTRLSDLSQQTLSRHKPQIMAVLRSLPDVSFRLKWEFTSPIFQLVLKQVWERWFQFLSNDECVPPTHPT